MDKLVSRFQTSRLEIRRLQYRAWTAADHTHAIQDFRDSIERLYLGRKCSSTVSWTLECIEAGISRDTVLHDYHAGKCGYY
jgi:hypothetical protein